MYKPTNTNKVNSYIAMGFDFETYRRYSIAEIKRRNIRLARRVILNNKKTLGRSCTCVFDCSKNEYFDLIGLYKLSC